jgi:hypothetical protein
MQPSYGMQPGIAMQTSVIGQNPSSALHSNMTFPQAGLAVQTSVTTNYSTTHLSSTMFGAGQAVHHSYLKQSETGKPDITREYIVVQEPGVPRKVRLVRDYVTCACVQFYVDVYMSACLSWLHVYDSCRSPCDRQTDRQTDRRTDGHNIYFQKNS